MELTGPDLPWNNARGPALGGKTSLGASPIFGQEDVATLKL